MSEENNIRSLLMTKESRMPTIAAYALTFLLLSVTTVDLLDDIEVTNQFTSGTPQWDLLFETQNQTTQIVETLQDDETRTIVFELSELSIPEGFFIGHIDVTILPEEQDGDDDWLQCDSIAGDIIQNELTAQWNDPENTLSGQDSSCVPIELDLRVYPNFTGETITVSAKNEFQALSNWTETTWGEGDLTIDLDLDVNTPLGLNSPTDSDEEITVDISVILFSVSVEQISTDN